MIDLGLIGLKVAIINLAIRNFIVVTMVINQTNFVNMIVVVDWGNLIIIQVISQTKINLTISLTNFTNKIISQISSMTTDLIISSIISLIISFTNFTNMMIICSIIGIGFINLINFSTNSINYSSSFSSSFINLAIKTNLTIKFINFSFSSMVNYINTNC